MSSTCGMRLTRTKRKVLHKGVDSDFFKLMVMYTCTIFIESFLQEHRPHYKTNNYRLEAISPSPYLQYSTFSSLCKAIQKCAIFLCRLTKNVTKIFTYVRLFKRI